jgi:SAM-dependent methyltransferase
LKYFPPPFPDNGDASAHLDTLLTDHIDAHRFLGCIRELQKCFDRYVLVCPAPFIAPGLIVSPELRVQCELYLPMAEISAAFGRLYRAALKYSPIISSTPFCRALSWADTFVELSPFVQFSVNSARLLEKLLADRELLLMFLCASFLPRRFYGGFGRYPVQQNFIRQRLTPGKMGVLHCLDAACGTGEETYGLTLLLAGLGFLPDEVHVEGWTLEPLEVWAATHRCFPHDRTREARFRDTTAAIFQQGYGRCLSFCCRDILTPVVAEKEIAGDARRFDLILCNGLLGGPIIHEKSDLERAVAHLASLLSPGGILLAADSFHAGWKLKCPQSVLRASFETAGLLPVEVGEGIGGIKTG